MNAGHRIAFLFPGQGSQYVGMGEFLRSSGHEVISTFDEADAALGFPLSQIISEGPEDRLTLTENAQPAILTVSVAMLRLLALHGIKPDMAAGHSLGAYSALVAAGALQFQDAVRLVRQRGQLMQQAVEPGMGAMTAILGLDEEKVRVACERASHIGIVDPANFNCPGQIVISGEKRAVDFAAQVAMELGARRAIPLAVSGPFHSRLMAGVVPELSRILRQTPVGRPETPFVSDTEAKPLSDPEDIRGYLARQVERPIRFQHVMSFMIESGMDTFIEVGPGKVLTGFLRRMPQKVHMVALDAPGYLESLLEILREDCMQHEANE